MNGAIENELKFIKYGISKTNKILDGFERKFEMSSQQFYKLFQKGQLGDYSDYIRWSGEIETLDRLEKEQNDLVEVEIC